MSKQAIKALMDNALQQSQDKPKPICDGCGDAVCDGCGDAVCAVDSNDLCFQCAITQHTAALLEEKGEVCEHCALNTAHEIMEIVCSKLMELTIDKETSLKDLLEEISKNMVPTELDPAAIIDTIARARVKLSQKEPIVHEHTANYTQPRQYKKLLELAYDNKNPSERYLDKKEHVGNGWAGKKEHSVELCEFWDGDITELDRIIDQIGQGTFPRPYRTSLDCLFWDMIDFGELGINIPYRVQRYEQR